jgi:hypothetical protein
MHPVHCLASRFENIVLLRRHNEHAVQQLRVAIEVVKARIIFLMKQEDIRKALNEIKMVFKFLKRTKAKRLVIFDLYGIDLFECIPNDERLGKDYVEKRYPQMRKVLGVNNDC